MTNEFTESEIQSMTMKLLMEIRIEQQRTRAYSEAFASLTLNEEQKTDFRIEFKKRYKKYLQGLVEDNHALFDEDIQALIDGLDVDTDKP